MNLWNLKTDCCGCTACANICPKNCIFMKADIEGFLYPIVDENKCVECGLCQKVCPMKATTKKSGINSVYIMQHKDKNTLKASSSGGFFSGIAKKLINDGYLIVGAVFDKDFNVIHTISESMKDIEKMRGSKYVQSDLNIIFMKIRNNLKCGKKICFVGTPCQTAALHKYLNDINKENLICIDFVCHGTASPGVWKRYVKFLEETYNSKLIEYSFRSKHKGHHNFGTFAKFRNGYEYYSDDLSDDKDFMHLAYFNEICSRPSCHACKFKTIERNADITMFDCWHVENFSIIKDNDEGFSTVIVHTTKGLNLLESIKMLYVYEDVTDKLEDIIRLDGGNAIFSMIPSPNRQDFFIDFSNGMSINDLKNKYLLNSIKSSRFMLIRKYSTNFLKKIGLFDYLRNIYYKRNQRRFLNSESNSEGEK